MSWFPNAMTNGRSLSIFCSSFPHGISQEALDASGLSLWMHLERQAEFLRRLLSADGGYSIITRTGVPQRQSLFLPFIAAKLTSLSLLLKVLSIIIYFVSLIIMDLSL